MNDLNEILLLPCPLIHCGHIFTGSLRPLCDKRLTRPAASGPIASVGIGQSARCTFPHDRQRLAADISSAEGCSGAEIVASESENTVKLGIAFGKVEKDLIFVLVFLNNFAVNHDSRALYELLRLCSLDRMRLKIGQADGSRCRLRSRRWCRRHGGSRCRRRLVELLISLHCAVHDTNKCNAQNNQQQYFNNQNKRVLLFLFLAHLYLPQKVYSVKCI